MGIGKLSSLAAQLVDVRCFYFCGTAASEIAVAEVVDVDKNDVRPGLGGFRQLIRMGSILLLAADKYDRSDE